MNVPNYHVHFALERSFTELEKKCNFKDRLDLHPIDDVLKFLAIENHVFVLEMTHRIVAQNGFKSTI